MKSSTLYIVWKSEVRAFQWYMILPSLGSESFNYGFAKFSMAPKLRVFMVPMVKRSSASNDCGSSRLRDWLFARRFTEWGRFLVCAKQVMANVRDTRVWTYCQKCNVHFVSEIALRLVTLGWSINKQIFTVNSSEQGSSAYSTFCIPFVVYSDLLHTITHACLRGLAAIQGATWIFFRGKQDHWGC